MTATIESTADIRAALGPVRDLLTQLSGIRGERHETDRLRRRMLRRYPARCAACGKPFGTDRTAEAAHVLALEEGGTTSEDNLVLLCHDCHRSYDAGRASTEEMRRAASGWRDGGDAYLAEVMAGRIPSELSQVFRPARVDALRPVYDLLQSGRYGRAIKAAAGCSKQALSADDHAASLILVAQVHRRRSARGSLTRSRRILGEIDGDRLPPHRRPLYFYERGYVCQMLGAHEESNRWFEASRSSAALLNDPYSAVEQVVANHRKLAVETIALPFAALASNEIARRSEQFDALIRDAAGFVQPHAGRWVHNIMGWKWRLLTKCADRSLAVAMFEDYRRLREQQQVMTGFTRAGSSHACGFAGLMRLHDDCAREDLREVLRLTSRALVSLLAYRVRPEGIRDFLLIFEMALARSARYRLVPAPKSTLRLLATVRRSILDGSSFLDPHRAAS